VAPTEHQEKKEASKEGGKERGTVKPEEREAEWPFPEKRKREKTKREKQLVIRSLSRKITCDQLVRG